MPKPSHRPVGTAIAWLSETQADSGEFPAWASPLDGEVPVWTLDSLNFITALAAIALDDLDRHETQTIVDRAVEFLVRERQPNGLWRYWASDNEQTDFTPADADDTACCSLSVSLRGHDTSDNVQLLLANRDRAGRFLTWFVPRMSNRSLRLRRALRDERRGVVRDLRTELWNTTEAEPNDVDVVVNANVCRYLGEYAPAEATEWVASTLSSGGVLAAEKWHRNATTLWLAVAEGARRGVSRFVELEGLVADQVAAEWQHGRLATPLDQAQGLLALQAFGARDDICAQIAKQLESTQTGLGCWDRSVYYYGGPKELFGWASEALTTSYAATALGRAGYP